MSVIFFPEGDIVSSSTRVRVYDIAKELGKLGINYNIIKHKVPHIYHPLDYFKKATFYFSTFFKVLFEFIKTKKEDVIFIHRYSAVPGLFLIDLFPKYILRRKVIFDFDDAIYLGPSPIKKILALEPFRTNLLLKSSDLVIVSSHYLKEYADKFTKKAVLVPTSIDMKRFSKFAKKNWKVDKKIKIGWIGSPTTLKYLKIMEPMLSELGGKYEIEFIVIGANKHEQDIPRIQNITITPVKWIYETEVKELSKIDIGVMPLYDTKWERAKAGFKILEYMALKIPVVASAVGENNYIVKSGYDGYLCRSEKEWIITLEKLILDEKLRKRFGQRGYKKVMKNYSLESNVKIIKNEILEMANSHQKG